MREKYKINDILEILWIDTHSSPTGWLDEEDIDDLVERINNHTMHTIGYFLRENKSYIYVLQTYDMQESRRVDGIIAITKGTIKKINKIKSSNK